MQPTTIGTNLTGASVTPASLDAMIQAASQYTPFDTIDTSVMEAQKLAYIAEADAVGSLPPAPTSAAPLDADDETTLDDGSDAADPRLAVFLDKLGERLAYERSGVRLYDALTLKLQAAIQADPDATFALVGDGDAVDDGAEDAAATVLRIRSEELAHFQMLSEAIETLGGDPTTMTPCADVTAVAASGFMQVLNDPRTTLAQCLNAMLAVELADNAGWELLAALADELGEAELAGEFLGALAQEQEHLEIVRQWLKRLVCDAASPALV